MKGDMAELVTAAAVGKSLSEIAEAAGISISTAQRRLNEPEVKEAIRQAQAERRREALARMENLRGLAIQVFEDVLTRGYPDVKLKAATTVLGASTKFEKMSSVGDRLSVLEDKVLGTQDFSPERDGGQVEDLDDSEDDRRDG